MIAIEWHFGPLDCPIKLPMENSLESSFGNYLRSAIFRHDQEVRKRQ